MAISPAPPPPGTQAWPMDQVPDPEVPERPTRRRFAAAYKAAILDELDHAIEPGAKGAILRREGLYSSHATDFASPAGARGSRSPGPGAVSGAFGGRMQHRRALCHTLACSGVVSVSATRTRARTPARSIRAGWAARQGNARAGSGFAWSSSPA